MVFCFTVELNMVLVCANLILENDIVCIVMLEPLSTLCVSFFHFFLFIYIFIADNISISVYIMCVILCLLSALTHFEPQGRRFTNFHYYYY